MKATNTNITKNKSDKFKGGRPTLGIGRKKTYRLNLNDILYVEALGDYVKIYTTDRMIISYHSMKNIETLLSPRQFPRIHKSFIVSLSKIELIEGNQVKLKDRYIPIGTNYKAEFEKLIRTI